MDREKALHSVVVETQELRRQTRKAGERREERQLLATNSTVYGVRWGCEASKAAL